MNKSDFLHILSDAQQNHEGWSSLEGAAFPNFNPGNLTFIGQEGAVANGLFGFLNGLFQFK